MYRFWSNHRQNRFNRYQRICRFQQLQTRSLLAADLDLIGSNPPEITSTGVSSFVGDSKAEGEAANDLVAFAKALTQAKVKLYGAPWDNNTNLQKNAFEEGSDFLDFVDVSNPDRSPNQVAIDLNITQFPVWILDNGTRLQNLQTLASLSTATGVAIPQSSLPSMRDIEPQTVEIGSPFHVPVNAYDPNGNPLSITVTSSNPENVVAHVLYGNQSAQIATDFGSMTFQLFNSEAQRPVDRFTALAQSGVYDTVGSREMTFHRIIEDFVIQGEIPKGMVRVVRDRISPTDLLTTNSTLTFSTTAAGFCPTPRQAMTPMTRNFS